MYDSHSLYTGRLRYKDIDFTFAFDGKELRLVPPKEKEDFVMWEWGYQKIEEGVYTSSEPTPVDEKYLIGICFETNSRIIFIPRCGSMLSRINATIRMTLVAYVVCRANRELINRIGFSCDELNYIHPINSAFSVALPQKQNKGIVSVNTNEFAETPTEKQSFVLDGKNVYVYFGISRTVSTRIHEPPIKLNTSMYFEFCETDDYNFIYELYWVAREFIRFLCYRKNVCFSKIELSAPKNDGKHENFASMFIVTKNVTADEESLKTGRLIKLQYLSGHEGRILHDIADESLYLRHLPDSYGAGRHINAARFVMITAAFEWEYRRLFPDGVKKSHARIDAEKCVSDTIRNLIDTNTGKKKEIYKFLIKLVRTNSLKDEIIHISKEFSDIIGLFGDHLYSLNKETLDYSEMGERLSAQRNSFAHGSLDKNFIGLSLLDLVFLEYIVYAIQLKYYGIEDINIKKAINELFHLNFAL